MKKVLKAIVSFLTSLFTDAKKYEQFLADHVDDAILVVSKIKSAVESPVITSLFYFFPEKYKNAGAEALQKIQAIIDKVLAELLVSDECLKKATLFEKLQCFVQQVKRLSPAMQEAAYLKFASLYAKHSSGAQLSSSTYDTAVQNRFFTKKESISV